MRPRRNGRIDRVETMVFRVSIRGAFRQGRRALLPCSMVCLLVTVALTAIAQEAAVAQEKGVFPRRHHAWARFKPGAWKTIRETTEVFDEDGKIKSTSIKHSRTTFLGIKGNQITLLVEGVTESVGGKHPLGPTEIKERLCGVAADQKVKLKTGGKATVTIDKKMYKCSVIEAVVTDPDKKTVTTIKIYFSDSVSPHVLRREMVTVDATSKMELSRTTISAYALDMPQRVLGEIRATSIFKAVYVNGETRTITWAVSCAAVPGEVISRTSKVLDSKNGRLLRRTTLELVDYDLKPAPPLHKGELRRLERRTNRRLFPLK